MDVSISKVLYWATVWPGPVRNGVEWHVSFDRRSPQPEPVLRNDAYLVIPTSARVEPSSFRQDQAINLRFVLAVPKGTVR
jgi:hypothetical protein